MNLPEEIIASKIFVIREVKVMLDSDLAELYQVETKRLNEQVKRNDMRFPEDFRFQLNEKEWEYLKSQFATSSWEVEEHCHTSSQNTQLNYNLVVVRF
ncbi:ORF6N domain-containing protein [Brumimicrobium oceani]|uniref:ORF6N domain-containing protein n=1 Tax=Brumimicrobium oceani TaxID=2100725 RepID=UPI001E62B8F5|nr:ORF6N domain-containing protein [Brumimicrobium oceani]